MAPKRISLPVIQDATAPAAVRQEPRGSARNSGPARPEFKFQEDGAGPRPRWIRKRVLV